MNILTVTSAAAARQLSRSVSRMRWPPWPTRSLYFGARRDGVSRLAGARAKPARW